MDEDKFVLSICKCGCVPILDAMAEGSSALNDIYYMRIFCPKCHLTTLPVRWKKVREKIEVEAKLWQAWMKITRG